MRLWAAVDPGSCFINSSQALNINSQQKNFLCACAWVIIFVGFTAKNLTWALSQKLCQNYNFLASLAKIYETKVPVISNLCGGTKRSEWVVIRCMERPTTMNDLSFWYRTLNLSWLSTPKYFSFCITSKLWTLNTSTIMSVSNFIYSLLYKCSIKLLFELFQNSHWLQIYFNNSCFLLLWNTLNSTENYHDHDCLNIKYKVVIPNKLLVTLQIMLLKGPLNTHKVMLCRSHKTISPSHWSHWNALLICSQKTWICEHKWNTNNLANIIPIRVSILSWSDAVWKS